MGTAPGGWVLAGGSIIAFWSEISDGRQAWGAARLVARDAVLAARDGCGSDDERDYGYSGDQGGAVDQP